MDNLTARLDRSGVPEPVLAHAATETALDGDDVRVRLEEVLLVEAGGLDGLAQDHASGLLERFGTGGQAVLGRPEELVDVEDLLVVLAEVQVLLVPVVRVDVEVRFVQEHHDLVRGHRLVARGVCVECRME